MSISARNEPFNRVFDHLDAVEKFARGLIYVFLAIIFVFSVGAGMSAPNNGWAVGTRAFCVCVVTVLAAAATGALLGFLFGIPRLLQRGSAPQIDSPSAVDSGSTKSAERKIAQERFFTSNTSFEEISDWLTKIIIGLSLVQFDTIMHYLHIAALFSASYITLTKIPAETLSMSSSGLPDGQLAISITFGFIVTSLFAACLITYLETRTRLTALFIRMEAVNHATGEDVVNDVLARPLAERPPTDSAMSNATDRQPVSRPATSADRALTAVPFSDLHSPTEIAAWGSAQVRAGKLDGGIAALMLALSEDPPNLTIRLRLAQALRLKGKIDDYVEEMLGIIKIKPTDSDVLLEAKSAMLDSLYLDLPGSFEFAIRLGEYLLATTFSSDPQVWLYLAAARGQEFKYKKDRSSPEQLAAIRKSALEAVEKVAALDPNPTSHIRVTLRDMYTSAGGDDDLHIFYQADDFDKAIG